jgi:hypothetical protein
VSVGRCAYCQMTAFLRPVDLFPGFAGPDCLLTLDLCLWCRLEGEDPRWSTPVVEFLHSPHREARECAQWALEWKDRIEVGSTQ